MKALILNCVSDAQDITIDYLNSFKNGLQAGGAEIKEFVIKDLEINPCYSCTAQYSFDYADKCRCDDDMNKLYAEFKATDTWIFASKIGANGNLKYLKNLLDRMEPLFQPSYFFDGGISGTIPPENKVDGKILFLSSMNENNRIFADNIVGHIDSLSLLFAKIFAGTIMINSEDLGNKDWNKTLTEQGRKFAEQGEIDIVSY
jgi:multimeric flavodoxin WrbA